MEKQQLNISCNTITLTVFMDCLFDNNYTALAPDATEEEQKEIWQKLKEEYFIKSGDAKQQHIFLLSKKIAVQEARLMVVRTVAEMPEKEGLKVLQKVGYAGSKSGINSRVRRDLVMLEVHRNELNRLFTAAANKQNSTRDDFIRWMVVVSKYIGYRIDPSLTTVLEFLSMDKMMRGAQQKIKH
jgi:hypothetical protein